jgi:type II secretory pathway component PulJ
MTILGLILVIIFQVFRLGLSSWEKGESAAEEYQKIRIVSQLLSQQVKSTFPYEIKTQKAESNYLAFEGKKQSLKFVSAFPAKSKRPEGLVFAVYDFKEGGRGEGSLVLYEQRVLNKDFFEEALKKDTGVTLLEGLSELRFEYYREADPENNKTEEWVDEWDAKEEKKLPRAVRITATFGNEKEGKQKSPMTLLVAIPANKTDQVITGPGRLRPRRSVPQIRPQGD